MRPALVLAAVAAACSSPAGQARPTDCEGAPAAVAEARRLAADGWLFKAHAAAAAAQARCPGGDRLLALADVLAELGRDSDARAAYLAYAETDAPGASVRARAGLVELAKRPSADRRITPEERTRASDLYRLGEELRFRGALDESLATFRRAYAAAPHPLIIMQIGLVHRARGDAVAERTSYARALAIAEATGNAPAKPGWAAGHLGQVTDLVLAAGERLLASGGADGTVRLWVRGVRRERLVLEHAGPIAELALSADGRLVAARTVADAVRVWDAGTGSRLLETHATALHFRSDGSLLLGGQELRTWTEATGIRVALRFVSDKGRVSFSDDGAIAGWLAGGELAVWKLDRLIELGRLPAVEPRRAWLQRDGSRVAITTSAGGFLWSVPERRVLLETHSLVDAAFARDRPVVALAGPASARVLDAVTGKHIAALQDSSETSRIWLTADGRIAAGLRRGTLVRWDATTGSRLGPPVDLGYDQVVAASLDASAIAYVADSGIEVVDSSSGEALASHGASLLVPTVPAIAAGGSLLAGVSATAGPAVARLVAGGASLAGDETSAGEVVLALEPLDRDAHVESGRDGAHWIRGATRTRLAAAGGERLEAAGEALAVAPGAEIIATTTRGDPARVLLWHADAAAPRLVRALPPRPEPIVALAFVDGGRGLAIASTGQTSGLALIDAASGRVRAEAAGPVYALAAAPDGARFAAGRPDGRLTVYDARSGRVDGKPIRLPDAIWSLVWARPDVILAGLESGEVAVVSVADRRAQGRVRVHRQGPVRRMARGASGVVATTGGDHAIGLLGGNGELRGHVVISNEGAWAAVAADRRVDASPGGEALIHWQVGDVQLPGFAGWQRQGSAGMLKELLRGVD